MLISKTYQITTPESAEYGDYAESGFTWESEKMTFKDLISEAESSGCIYHEGCDWLYSDSEIEDYSTGETVAYALHFDRENKPKDAKYWDKAILYLVNQRKKRRGF